MFVDLSISICVSFLKASALRAGKREVRIAAEMSRSGDVRLLAFRLLMRCRSDLHQRFAALLNSRCGIFQIY